MKGGLRGNFIEQNEIQHLIYGASLKKTLPKIPKTSNKSDSKRFTQTARQSLFGSKLKKSLPDASTRDTLTADKATLSLISVDTAQLDQASVFEQHLKKVLEDDPKATPFQKQSISERLELLRNLGYKQDTTIIYQDNTSTITMAYMGRGGSGSRTRHIDIKYFYVKQFLDSKALEIDHLGRDNMTADFFASPRQGAMFRRFRGMIMGEIL